MNETAASKPMVVVPFPLARGLVAPLSPRLRTPAHGARGSDCLLRVLPLIVPGDGRHGAEKKSRILKPSSPSAFVVL